MIATLIKNGQRDRSIEEKMRKVKSYGRPNKYINRDILDCLMSIVITSSDIAKHLKHAETNK